MNNDLKKLTLSESQLQELHELKKKYQDTIGYDVSDPAVWFGTHITNYLGSLMIEAAIGNRQEKKAIAALRKGIKFRKNCMDSFENYLKRKPLAEDIILELSRIVTIPNGIADFIRQDFEQLQQ